MYFIAFIIVTIFWSALILFILNAINIKILNNSTVYVVAFALAGCLTYVQLSYDSDKDQTCADRQGQYAC